MFIRTKCFLRLFRWANAPLYPVVSVGWSIGLLVTLTFDNLPAAPIGLLSLFFSFFVILFDHRVSKGILDSFCILALSVFLVGRSVGQSVGPSVRRSVRRSIRHKYL